MTSDSELDTVMALMDASFDPHWREAWNREQVRDSLAMPSTFLQFAQDGEGAHGFVLSRQALDEEELLLIAICPEQRGRGLGRELLHDYFSAARCRGVRRIFLEMRANNPAHSFYLRSGFRPIGTRPRYYLTADGSTIDAITFAVTLSD